MAFFKVGDIKKNWGRVGDDGIQGLYKYNIPFLSS